MQSIFKIKKQQKRKFAKLNQIIILFISFIVIL